MVVYKLYYFNLMGRAEMMRILFAQAGVKYEDIRLSQEEWAKFKPETPFGQMPILEVDGEKFCQSDAIVGYLANEFNFVGKNNLEQFTVAMVGFCFREIFEAFPFAEKDPKCKEEKMKEWMGIAMEKLKKVEAMLVKNNGGDQYFVSKLTTADFASMFTVQFLEKINPALLEAIPKLTALGRRVQALPKIAQHLKTRPKTDM